MQGGNDDSIKKVVSSRPIPPPQADILSSLGISACQNWFQLGICIKNAKEAATSLCTLAWVLL